MDEEEIVDIVDERGRVLYPLTKVEAHQKGLLHKTVIAEVRDSKGRWLLIEQAPHKQDAGQYVSPVGGHVKSGESEEEALKREAMEEIGLENFEYELVGRKIFNRTVLGRHENHYFIVFKITTDEPLKLGDEAVGYKAFEEEYLQKELEANPNKFGGAFFFVVENFYPHLLSESKITKPRK